MAIFEFRLEDPNSNHFREGLIEADTKEEATEILTEREQKKVDFRLTTDDLNALAIEAMPNASDEDRSELSSKLLNEGTDMEGFYNLPGRIRGHVAVHHQADPYTLSHIKKERGT